MEEVMEELGTVGVGTDDIFETGSLPKPAAKPDAHEAVINGVTTVTFDSGATCVQLELSSQNVPLDFNKRYFVPKDFVADIYCDKASLPSEDKNNQLGSYVRTIQNDKGDADFQKLRAIAANQGITSADRGLTKPATFADYVENMNKLLSGLRVIVVRRPGKDDYADRLEVAAVYGPEVKDEPGKKFRGVDRLMWEQN